MIRIKYDKCTLRQEYTITCNRCGGKRRKVLRQDYSEFATPKDREDCRIGMRLEVERLKARGETCKVCKNDAITAQVIPISITVDVLAEINAIELATINLLERQKALQEKFRQHNGRIFYAQDHQYVQESACFNAWYSKETFRIEGRRINKRCPWEVVDERGSFPIGEVTYCNETLRQRREKVSRL